MPPIISKIILLKGGFPKRWDKNLVQEILPEGRIINRVLLIEGYLHVSTFYSAESKEVTVGMVWICLDRRSTTTRMVLYPFESRSSLIMSMGITCQCQSGTLLGISFPTFCVGKVFVWLHVSHPTTNLVTYLDSPGHQ